MCPEHSLGCSLILTNSQGISFPQESGTKEAGLIYKRLSGFAGEWLSFPVSFDLHCRLASEFQNYKSDSLYSPFEMLNSSNPLR